MTRAVSTVLDVGLFLLLVGVATGTLVAGTAALDPEESSTDQRPPNPGETATLLATTTAEVEYALTPTQEGAGITISETEGDLFRRSAHGTLASLLADAAVGATTIDGQRLTPATRGYRDAVGERTEELPGVGEYAQVTVVWTPFEGSGVRGAVTVGPDPPAAADVYTASLRVPTAAAGSADRASAAAAADEPSYEAIARVAASATVDLLAPPDRGQLALRGDRPTDALAARRYRRLGEAVDVETDVGDMTLNGTRERLAEGLVDRYELVLRERYETPAAAAEAVRAGRVRIVVRWWSA